MSLYDNFLYQTECPACGETIGAFQSKLGPCIMDDYTEGDSIRGWSMHLRYVPVYTICDLCGEYVEANIKVSKLGKLGQLINIRLQSDSIGEDELTDGEIDS